MDSPTVAAATEGGSPFYKIYEIYLVSRDEPRARRLDRLEVCVRRTRQKSACTRCSIGRDDNLSLDVQCV